MLMVETLDLELLFKDAAGSNKKISIGKPR